MIQRLRACFLGESKNFTLTFFCCKKTAFASAKKKFQQWLYLLVLSIAGIFHRALQLLSFDNKKFRCENSTTTAATSFSAMGNTEVCPIASNIGERCICTILTTKSFVVKTAQLLPLTFFSSMGSTHSTAHRLEKANSQQPIAKKALRRVLFLSQIRLEQFAAG